MRELRAATGQQDDRRGLASGQPRDEGTPAHIRHLPIVGRTDTYVAAKPPSRPRRELVTSVDLGGRYAGAEPYEPPVDLLLAHRITVDNRLSERPLRFDEGI